MSAARHTHLARSPKGVPVPADFGHLNAAFVSDMTGWLKDGRIKHQETVLEGFERAPEGLIGLFEGRNTGKMLIHIAD